MIRSRASVLVCGTDGIVWYDVLRVVGHFVKFFNKTWGRDFFTLLHEINDPHLMTTA